MQLTGPARDRFVAIAHERAHLAGDTLIREAWLLASVQYGAPQIRSGYLLLGLLSNDRLARWAREASSAGVARLAAHSPTAHSSASTNTRSGW